MLTVAEVIDDVYKGKQYCCDVFIGDFCESQTGDVDNDWMTESTTYKFKDGSEIVVCGTDYELS